MDLQVYRCFNSEFDVVVQQYGTVGVFNRHTSLDTVIKAFEEEQQNAALVHKSLYAGHLAPGVAIGQDANAAPPPLPTVTSAANPSLSDIDDEIPF
jgi:hypothetical protein